MKEQFPTIVIDTREQAPLSFGAEVPTVRRGLPEGDYSFVGAEGRFAVERKSIDDLFATVVSDRERFERELERLSRYEFAAIVIEASVDDVRAFTSPESTGITEAQRRARPATVLHSLISWDFKYGVRVYFVSKDRDVCARWVLRLAQKFAASVKTAGAA